MIDSNGKSTVTVKKAELIGVLRKNLESHRDLFLQAQEGYRKEVIRRLEVMLQDARDNKRVQYAIQLIAPTDQSKDYERIIRMLEMSVAEEVTVSETEFAQYVLDDWHWKANFTANATSYLGQ